MEKSKTLKTLLDDKGKSQSSLSTLLQENTNGATQNPTQKKAQIAESNMHDVSPSPIKGLSRLPAVRK